MTDVYSVDIPDPRTGLGISVGPASYGHAVAYFALTLVHGPGWDAALPTREQDGWSEHATFMDRLVDDGVIVVGGPLGNGERTLHLVEAIDEAHVKARLDDDPWALMGLLQVGSIEKWELWLDGRRRAALRRAGRR